MCEYEEIEISLKDLKSDYRFKESFDEELMELMQAAMKSNAYEHQLVQSGLSYLDTICSTRFDLIKKHEKRYIDKTMKFVLSIIDASIKFDDIDMDFLTGDLPKRVKDEDFESQFAYFICLRAYEFLGNFGRHVRSIDSNSAKYVNKIADLIVKKTYGVLPEVQMGFNR